MFHFKKKKKILQNVPSFWVKKYDKKIAEKQLEV